MDNTTLPFYFVWTTLKLGTYFPMEVKPCVDRQYDTQKGEVVNPPYIKVDVPADPIYVDMSNGTVLTVEGARYCVEQLNKIFEPKKEQPTDGWDLEASKADEEFDKVFNS